MTALEQRQADFATLSGAYSLLSERRASNALLLGLLDHVNLAHSEYKLELERLIADAKAGVSA